MPRHPPCALSSLTRIPTRFLVSRGTLDPAVLARLSCTGLSPSLAGFPKTILLGLLITYAVRTPECSHPGLGSSAFARRYSQNRCFFLFLRLLRCFSSPGSLLITYAVRTPECSHPGLGSSAFARRYSQNRCFFLFLRLLRCFSSPGSLLNVMYCR